ncbi:MAG TPA: transglutaminase family protein, partial [Bryobacteraceae bacterium]|nr:transglutaminase family protein [Bryobacteraceae bacterium]
MLAFQPCLEAKALADSQAHSAPVRRIAHPAALFQTAQVNRAPSHRLASAADPTDPYIIAEATALNNDPNKIFAFVRDNIAFQAYHGSVRGARGTLWSMGGNSLDKSSLLIALLGAAGISAQYVQGTITTAQEQTLIGSMFTAPSRVVGCIPPGTALADPVNDATLQTAISDHYWVESGPSNTPMDPSFAGA